MSAIYNLEIPQPIVEWVRGATPELADAFTAWLAEVKTNPRLAGTKTDHPLVWVSWLDDVNCVVRYLIADPFHTVKVLSIADASEESDSQDNG